MPLGGWRFIAQRLTGDGSSGDFLDFDVPLESPEITDTLSGHNSLSGTLAPKIARMLASDGEPLFKEWGSAIWAENQGHIRGGGIVTHADFSGPEFQIECTGYTGYLDGLPYTDAWYGVEIDPLDVVRHIWDHVQGKPGGNLAFEISDLKTGLKIGEKLRQAQYDSQYGPMTFEAGPVKLAWYETHNLGDTVNQLASDTPFDWHERHFWDGDIIRHVLDFGYPRLGRRRTDLRFVIGENIFDQPDVTRDGADYATEVMTLGSGTGRTMVRGMAARPVSAGLRRVAVVTDSSLRTIRACNARSRAELAWRNDLTDLTDVYVRNTPMAPVGAIEPGDEILLQGDTEWLTLDVWVRVISKKYNPADNSGAALTVVKSDRS